MNRFLTWLLIFGNSDESLRKDTISYARTIWLVIVSLSVFLIWSAYANVDQITRAQGTVISSSRSQVLQSADGGVLENLLVKEGDLVEAGQLLAQLDTTKLQAAYEESVVKSAALSINIERLRAEILDKPPNFSRFQKHYPQFVENQQRLFEKRTASIREELEALRQLLLLSQQELQLNEPLLKTGDVSQTEVLRLRRQVGELQAQIANKKNKYLQDGQAELSKTEEELAGIMQVLAQRKDQLDRSSLTAPMKGVVKNIRVTTIGGVLRASEELMQIVPSDDDLIVEAKIRPADVGFLRTGLPATVKIDAYDYTIYGSMSGELIYLSADTLKEENRQGEVSFYAARVKVKADDFGSHQKKRLEIQPGMSATVEIKTGAQSVLSYITKPIVKTVSESLGER